MTNSENIEKDSREVEKITVIALQEYSTPEDSSSHVSIISSDEIKASGARNIGEILKGVVGTYIQNYGSLGSTSLISIRGSSSEQVLVLINGKRLNAAQGGGVDFSTINPENIERIEVTRGGASAIHGENAFGGVINIITKKGDKETKTTVSYSCGSYQTHIGDISIQGSMDKKRATDYFLSFRGISSAGNYLFVDQKRGTTEERVNTGLLAGDLAFKIGWDVNREKDRRLSFDIQMHQDDKGIPGMVDFPTVSANMNESRIIAMLGYEHSELPVIPKGKANIEFYAIRQIRNFTDEEFYLGSINDKHDNRTLGLDTALQSIMSGWISQKIRLQYSYRWDWLRSTGLEKSPGILEEGEIFREAHSISGLDELHLFQYSRKIFGRIVITPALRYDINNLYENVLSKQLGLILNTERSRRLIIKGNAGTSYRAPSFDDLFWPATAFAIGNPDLKSERSVNWDVGLLIKFYRWLSTEMVYYNSEVKDLIQWNPGPGGQWRPENVDKVLMQGIEAEIKTIWILQFISGYLETAYNYALMYITDKTGESATDGKQLPRRPFEKAGFLLSLHSPGSFFIRWDTQFVGFRYITAHNLKYLDSYFSHDLNMGIYLYDNYEISLHIKNILDKEYIDIREYPIPGREIMLKMGVRF
ncbi:MAG: TonB-dependent receptor [Spirochaetes bacterium]|nr:TonB-dependent receptor [Spirochaetota bacterium]